jgi:hypothetical protein
LFLDRLRGFLNLFPLKKLSRYNEIFRSQSAS